MDNGAKLVKMLHRFEMTAENTIHPKKWRQGKPVNVDKGGWGRTKTT